MMMSSTIDPLGFCGALSVDIGIKAAKNNLFLIVDLKKLHDHNTQK